MTLQFFQKGDECSAIHIVRKNAKEQSRAHTACIRYNDPREREFPPSSRGCDVWRLSSKRPGHSNRRLVRYPGFILKAHEKPVFPGPFFLTVERISFSSWRSLVRPAPVPSVPVSEPRTREQSLSARCSSFPNRHGALFVRPVGYAQ